VYRQKRHPVRFSSSWLPIHCVTWLYSTTEEFTTEGRYVREIIIIANHLLQLPSSKHAMLMILVATYTLHRSVVKIGGPNSFFRPFFSFFYPPSPTSPLPLEVGPLKCSQRPQSVSSTGGGALYVPQMGSVAEPHPRSNFVQFYPQKSCSGNDSNDFTDN